MGCLLVVLALISPRLALIILWLTTNFVDRAFDGLVLPIIGFIFLPITTLVYILAYAPGEGVTGVGWVFVVFAVFMDLSAHGGAKRYRDA